MEKLLSDLVYGLIAPLIANTIALLAGIGTFIMYNPAASARRRA